jgi:hypothetical protein
MVNQARANGPNVLIRNVLGDELIFFEVICSLFGQSQETLRPAKTLTELIGRHFNEPFLPEIPDTFSHRRFVLLQNGRKLGYGKNPMICKELKCSEIACSQFGCHAYASYDKWEHHSVLSSPSVIAAGGAFWFQATPLRAFWVSPFCPAETTVSLYEITMQVKWGHKNYRFRLRNKKSAESMPK